MGSCTILGWGYRVLQRDLLLLLGLGVVLEVQWGLLPGLGLELRLGVQGRGSSSSFRPSKLKGSSCGPKAAKVSSAALPR